MLLSKSRIVFEAAFYLPVCGCSAFQNLAAPQWAVPRLGFHSWLERRSLLRGGSLTPRRARRNSSALAESVWPGTAALFSGGGTSCYPYLATMAVAGCTRCIKYMLFFFNFIFWVSLSDFAFTLETPELKLKYWRVFFWWRCLKWSNLTHLREIERSARVVIS